MMCEEKKLNDASRRRRNTGRALIVQGRQEWGRGVQAVRQARSGQAAAITSLSEVPWIKEEAWVAVMMLVFYQQKRKRATFKCVLCGGRKTGSGLGNMASP